ncbi:MAG: hypothetical protein P8076_00045 [Gammaproteobacteria bacterium]
MSKLLMIASNPSTAEEALRAYSRSAMNPARACIGNTERPCVDLQYGTLPRAHDAIACGLPHQSCR